MYRSGVPYLLVAKMSVTQVVIHQIVADRGDHAGLMVVEVNVVVDVARPSQHVVMPLNRTTQKILGSVVVLLNFVVTYHQRSQVIHSLRIFTVVEMEKKSVATLVDTRKIHRAVPLTVMSNAVVWGRTIHMMVHTNLNVVPLKKSVALGDRWGVEKQSVVNVVFPTATLRT